ncbi:MAG: hypothetical protein R2734_00585 [Nocardioides sp.]
MGLSAAAAGFVDRQVAAVAGRVSPQLDRLVLEARVRHDGPRARGADDPYPARPDTRAVDVWTDQVSFDGTVRVTGELDLADALHPRPGPQPRRRAAAAGRLGRVARRPTGHRTRRDVPPPAGADPGGSAG